MIKRLIGGNSDGVIVGVNNARDITSAVKALLADGHAVLVEQVVAGTELRLHFIAGRLHRAMRAEAYTIVGDGKRSLAELIAEHYPNYLRTMSGSVVHRRRLMMCLWGLGVRTLADLKRVIPENGRTVRISAATGAESRRVTAADFIPKRDIARIERFLAHHGAPSCGIDVIVTTPRASFNDGGVILEVNVPCGFAYLDNPGRAVAADLDAAISGDATFRRDKGRVPVWLVMESDARKLIRPAERHLRKRHKRVVVAQLDATRSNWVSLLNQPDADAPAVVEAGEASILAHGIPVNLAPVLVSNRTPAEMAAAFPVTSQTVKHAGGRCRALPVAV